MSVRDGVVSAASFDSHGGRCREVDSGSVLLLGSEVTCLMFNTDACGRVCMISENGDPEVSGPSACGMNDAYRRMIPVFWAVFIMRPYHQAFR